MKRPKGHILTPDMTLFPTEYGYAFLGVYALIVFGVTFLFSRGRKQNKFEFLLASESVHPIVNAVSVAATWTWAPALFVASQQAYLNGVAGTMWFLVPNVLCLMIFSIFGKRIRKFNPHKGYSISSYFRTRFSSKRLQFLYMLEISILSTCSFTVQLLAGGSVLSNVTGVDFFIVSILMSLIALAYSATKGLRASVITDALQMCVMLIVVVVVIPWALANASSLGVDLSAGWNGVNKVSGAFDLNVFLTFGLATTIGLLSGPYGDQTFWQRAAAVKEKHVFASFFLGAFVFAIVPTLMSLLGFLAAATATATNASIKVSISDPQLTNIAVIQKFLPSWTLIPFVAVILSGLGSTLDSMLSSIAAITAHDFFNSLPFNKPSRSRNKRKRKGAEVGVEERYNDVDIGLPNLNLNHGAAADVEIENGDEHDGGDDGDGDDGNDDKHALIAARVGMCVMTLLSCGLSLIPGFKIQHMFLVYGALRATVFLPTVISLISDRIHEAGMFYGILLALCIGWPLFVYGQVTGQWVFHVSGTLIEIFVSGGVCIVVSLILNRSRNGSKPPGLHI